MDKAKAKQEAFDGEVVEDATKPVAETTQAQVGLTFDDLRYLYTILMNSNVPSVDAKFVYELQQKLKSMLQIPN